MRVVHVINSLTGSGGAEHGLVREIVRLSGDVEQKVVMLHEPATLVPVVEEAGAEVESLGLDPAQSGWNWIVGAQRLRGLLEAAEPDVVHSSLASANVVAQLATRGSNVPVLSTFTLSGDVSLMRSYQPGADSLKASLFRGVSGLSARQGHIWFRALTEDAARTNAAALKVDPSRVIVIPRGVPLTQFDQEPPSREDLGLPEGIPVLLNVGRQTAQKGHARLIDAFKEFRHHRPAHLVILGRTGDGTPALSHAIERSGVEHSITVIPYTESVAAYYKRADLFVFTSLMEGLGTAVIEAMAAGLPVLAFDIPPVHEVTDGGRVAELVPVGDTAALLESMNRLIDSENLRREMAVAARELVETRFDIDLVAERLKDALFRLASGCSVLAQG